MAIGAKLSEALISFTRTEGDIVAFGQNLTPANAMEFVRLRRELVLEFAKLGTALEVDPLLTANPDLKTQGLRLFSAFRSQNSINQANWPAIRVRDDLENYRISSKPVVEASRNFWGWIEKELGFKR